ncbi:MAG: peptidoglycan DD-metalloendopeptidase family protein [Pseudolabrys sp.]|nr:peptidoglycan DD-metalloendopeptidase family protein [Pseudolabrys sp.]
MTIAAAQDKKEDTLKQRDQQLEILRGEQRRTAENEAALKREIEQLGADRRKLNQDLIDTAGRIRDLETKTLATEARLKPLDDQDAAIKKSLDARRDVIAEVLAALQRIGRRPPPALLMSPEQALQSVRAAIVLGAVVPEMRQEAEKLAAELHALMQVRQQIALERDQLRNEQTAIANDRARMAALIEERQKQQSEREAALIAERVRAADLAQQFDSLKDLIAALEKELDPTTRAAREAARNDARPAMAAFRDPGRLAPATAFASLRGQVRVPVNGVKIRDYGAPDGAGGVEKGLSITTRAGAQVTAPADGWVVYAGPFRSYGQLLILNAGGGYHVLLAGMERISVDLGQFVLTGEPVATMGTASHIAAILATGSSQPVLYVEFRKDGIPIDPGPWWAATEIEKVRG